MLEKKLLHFSRNDGNWIEHIKKMTDSSGQKNFLMFPDVVRELYKGILQRPADESGFASHLRALEDGVPLASLVKGMISSDEFQIHHPIATGRAALPDLTELYPGKYVRKEQGFSLFDASDDDDFRLLEFLIGKHRFYDSNDIYPPRIDLDKRITAAIVAGLGARSCIEMGCFSGSVLSVLESRGVDVCGIDVSHLAFVLAYPNIRDKLRFGDLLDLHFDRTYDAYLGMDILEHLNPLKLDAYLARIGSLVGSDGFVYINSPMFGHDDVFGTMTDQFLPEWEKAGPENFWRHLHCDEKGWPVHGHLIFASPQWWERVFLKHGFVRDRDIEREIHSMLGPFFDHAAPARRSLFVLRRDGYTFSLSPDFGNVPLNVTLDHRSNHLSWREFSDAESEFRWNSGRTAAIVFECKVGTPHCARIVITADTHGRQRILISLNGVPVLNLTEAGVNVALAFDVTNLSSGVNFLEFQLPDSRSPGNGDLRELGIAIRTLSISTAPELKLLKTGEHISAQL